MAYTTVAQVREYLMGVDLTTIGANVAAQDAEITKALVVGDAWVDEVTGRVFTLTQNTEKLFDGTGTERLWVPDLHNLDSWKIDGTTQANADLTCYPLSIVPSRWLRFENNVFPEGIANIAITGDWGWNSVPAIVAYASAMATAADVLLRLSGDLTEGSESVTQGLMTERYGKGAYWGESQRLMEKARELLRDYVRATL